MVSCPLQSGNCAQQHLRILTSLTFPSSFSQIFQLKSKASISSSSHSRSVCQTSCIKIVALIFRCATNSNRYNINIMMQRMSLGWPFIPLDDIIVNLAKLQFEFEDIFLGIPMQSENFLFACCWKILTSMLSAVRSQICICCKTSCEPQIHPQI